MSEDSRPDEGQALDSGEQARAGVYRLLGALLAGPPNAALIDLMRDIRPPENANDTAMAAAWQGLQAAAGSADPDRLKD